jgi:hypothetical protein
VGVGQQRIGQDHVDILTFAERRDLLVDVVNADAHPGALDSQRRHEPSLLVSL